MLAVIRPGVHVCEVSTVRRGQVLILLALASGVMSVLLAVAVNVATGGTLPGPLAGYAGWAWPAVGLLAVVTVALAFWQQNLQERSSGHPAQLMPASVSSPALVPAELPEQSVHFAGRERELAALRALVDGGARVVAIAGTAGVGKSSLALHLARSMRSSYPDGQLYVRLRGASAEPAQPAAVLARFLAVLGAPDTELSGDPERLAARFRTRLAGRRVLILLDDAADARQVRPLLPGAAGCLTIVTSRPVLGGLGEAALFDLGVMGQREAFDVLASLVGEEKLAAEPEATASVLASCGYLPLAVGIAGGRLRARPGWTVAALAARLADERHRLDELRLGDSEVRASFATSYAELPEPDRRLFRRLGAHPGAELGVGAAAALAGADQAEVDAVLERLADVRLVEVVGPDRYWRHDLTRLFAAERLAAEEPASDRLATFSRLVTWYAAAAADASIAWFRLERENLLATVHRAVELGEHEQAWLLVDAVEETAVSRATAADQRRLWTDALTAADALGDPVKEARARYRLGGAFHNDGYVVPALDHLAEALALWEAVGDPAGEAAAHGSLADALREAGQHREAIGQYEESLRLCRAHGLDVEEVDVLLGLGTVYVIRHEGSAAVPVLERAVRARTSHGAGPAQLAWPELLLGVAYKLEGRRDDGARLIDRSLAAFRRIGDRRGEAYALREVAYLAYSDGRHADALHHFAEVEALYERDAFPLGVSLAREGTGDTLLAAGDVPAAVAAYEQAAAGFAALDDRARHGLSLLKSAQALLAAGEPAQGRRAEAEQILAGIDLPEADAVRARLDGGTAGAGVDGADVDGAAAEGAAAEGAGAEAEDAARGD